MRAGTIALTAAAVIAALAVTQSAAQRRGFERDAPPAGPAPVNADGRVVLDGQAPGLVGVWTPLFGITDPVAPLETVPFQPWSKALYDTRQTSELEPHARCKASGASRQFLTPYGVEIVEIPELERLYIFDIGGPHTFRIVYMDGRSHPDDLQPTNYGHSIGWWDGNTLVIDTVGYNEDFWFGRRGLPHTEALHTVERLTRVSDRETTYELEVDDPGAYTAPFKGGFNLRWNEGTELFEYICQQANYAAELMVGSGGQESVDRSSTIVP
jgi:hypothetical protein